MDVNFIRGDWNANLESQEIHGITGKIGHGVQNDGEQKLKAEFCNYKGLKLKQWQRVFWGSKIPGDNDYSHEKKGLSLPGRKAMTNLDTMY